MTKRFGFTLAEVLITLGIIGVVAAMTIPTLIANTNSAKFRSQFKKSISTLNQAGLMAQAQYDIDYSTYDTATACTGTESPNTNANYSFCAIFNGTLAGHGITTTAPTVAGGASYAPTGNNSSAVFGTPASNPGYLRLADGSMVVFNLAANGCSKDIGVALDSTWATNHATCTGYIDVNGVTLPNKEVKCGTATTAIEAGVCEVPNDANHMTDIYPIAFHDATVEPLTNAARYVLTTSK